MTANELRQKYIDFFKGKGHALIPSASLIPENDPTVLFTTAGMHPLVPFLLGESHPAGKRLVSCQRCIRTGDIDLVGDDTHLTFFEMLGNWSLGDYWKKEAIEWSWEFLTSKQWLGLDPSRLFITCFAGDTDAPKDDESADIWRSVGVADNHIAFLGKDDNWWGPAGQTGPCGPDTEMFYQVNTEEDERPGNAQWPKGKYVEIWNDVFMQYNKTADGRFEPLKQKNVDTGMGVERTLLVLNKKKSAYEVSPLVDIINFIKKKTAVADEMHFKILADHIRTSVFLIADGVLPSNKEQGYVLRRLLRKVIRYCDRLNFQFEYIPNVIELITNYYNTAYPHVEEKKMEAIEVFRNEESRFSATLKKGLRELEKLVRAKETQEQYLIADDNRNNFGSKSEDFINAISGEDAFNLYQTYGIPPDLLQEEFAHYGMFFHEAEFNSAFENAQKRHQDLSRKGAEQKFKGGLADHSERVVRMHTATHLLHQALRDVLGNHVHQKGSNITAERLRFDFTHPQKVTAEELKKVEAIVNEKVAAAVPVEKKVLSLEEARKLGAIGLFGEKYGETVSVYTVGDYSKEFCGGPHVTNTKEVGPFSILKEEAVSAGVRRIKATVKEKTPV